MEICYQCSGSSIVSVFSESPHVGIENEGLLFGKIDVERYTEVNDDQQSVEQLRIIITIQSFVDVGGHFSLYDANSQLDTKLVDQYASEHVGQAFLGMYKFRGETHMIPSRRDRIVFRQLCAHAREHYPHTLKSGQIPPVVFALFRGLMTKDLSVHSFDHKLYHLSSDASLQLSPTSLTLANLASVDEKEYQRFHATSALSERPDEGESGFMGMGCDKRFSEWISAASQSPGPQCVALEGLVGTTLDKLSNLADQLCSSSGDILREEATLRQLQNELAVAKHAWSSAKSCKSDRSESGVKMEASESTNLDGLPPVAENYNLSQQTILKEERSESEDSKDKGFFRGMMSNLRGGKKPEPEHSPQVSVRRSPRPEC
eukprot:720262_1